LRFRRTGAEKPRPRIVDVPGHPRPTGPLGGDAAVAVRAPHFAERDLGLDAWPRRPAGDESADQLVLLAEMVHVEHAEVLLAAVGAWMLAEVRDHRPACSGRPPAARAIGLLKMLRTAGLEVVAEALATPMLEPRAGSVERGRRQVPIAPAAVLALIGHEHMFASAPDGAAV